MTLPKYFSRPSLVIYFFATPPIKVKLGQQIGEGLLIANHLDQSLRRADQKHWAEVWSYLLDSFLQMDTCAASFTSHCNVCNYAEPKPISWAKPYILAFLYLILLCRITYWAPLEMLSLPYISHCAQNGVIQHCWHSHSSQCPFAVAIESKFCCRGLSIDKYRLHWRQEERIITASTSPQTQT